MLQSMGSQRVRHELATKQRVLSFVPYVNPEKSQDRGAIPTFGFVTDNRIEKDFFLSILIVSRRESPFGLTCLILANPLF